MRSRGVFLQNYTVLTTNKYDKPRRNERKAYLEIVRCSRAGRGGVGANISWSNGEGAKLSVSENLKNKDTSTQTGVKKHFANRESL